eukprot:SAG31_NODE_5142_length_2718_cov_1.991600_1_plen_578_part_00
MCFSEFPNFNSDITISGRSQAGCEGYSIPCPADGQNGLAAEQRALTEYLLDQAQRAVRSPEAEEVVERVVSDFSSFVSTAAYTFKQRVDAASDLYIGYCILRLWWPSPLLICRTPTATAVRRSLFGLSKQTFVVVILVVWLLYDAWIYVKQVFDADLTVYLANVAADPCYLDSDFLSLRAAAIASICAEVKNMSRMITAANVTMSDLYADIVAFGPAPLPDGCGCEYPGNRSQIDGYMLNNITGLRPFEGNLSFCTDVAAQQKLLNPPETGVSWYSVWFKSGIVARLIVKVTLVNLAYAILGYTDPLACVGGKYEVHRHSSPLPTEAQDDLAALLGYQHLRDALVWGFVAVVAIINLAWPRDDEELRNSECADSTAENGTVVLSWLFVCLWAVVLVATCGGCKMLDRRIGDVKKITEIIEMMRAPPPLPTGTTAKRLKMQNVVRRMLKVRQIGSISSTDTCEASTIDSHPAAHNARGCDSGDAGDWHDVISPELTRIATKKSGPELRPDSFVAAFVSASSVSDAALARASTPPRRRRPPPAVAEVAESSSSSRTDQEEERQPLRLPPSRRRDSGFNC